jgi:hypothetical protein
MRWLRRRRFGVGGNVTRLILTSSSGMGLVKSGRADVVVPFPFRFVGGPLPSENELSTYVAARSPAHGPGEHWSDYLMWGQSSDTADDEADEDLGLVELGKRCESVELWFDPDPNDQLLLIWLLDCFHSHPEIASRTRLSLIDSDLIMMDIEYPCGWSGRIVDLTGAEFATASTAWQAYRAPTPQACFDLIGSDLSPLPMLRLALIDLLEELPSATTGLGRTELRLLEMIGRGYSRPNALFHFRGFGQQMSSTTGRLATCSRDSRSVRGPPSLASMRNYARSSGEMTNTRLEAFRRSRLMVTDFGEAVLAHKADFSGHNPIHRWWGGTELTNDRLWRLKPVLMKS